MCVFIAEKPFKNLKKKKTKKKKKHKEKTHLKIHFIYLVHLIELLYARYSTIFQLREILPALCPIQKFTQVKIHN